MTDKLCFRTETKEEINIYINSNRGLLMCHTVFNDKGERKTVFARKGNKKVTKKCI